MWRELLPAVGATVSYSEKGLTVTGSPAVGGEREYVFDLARCGELAPTLAAICALLPARTELRGIAHLRGHETDRLKALRVEINRLGGSAHELDDGLVIDAPVQRAATNAAVTVWPHSRRYWGCVCPVWWLRILLPPPKPSPILLACGITCWASWKGAASGFVAAEFP